MSTLYYGTYEWKPNKRNNNVLHHLNRLQRDGWIAQWDRNRAGWWFVRPNGGEWVLVGPLQQIEAFILGTTTVLKSRANG